MHRRNINHMKKMAMMSTITSRSTWETFLTVTQAYSSFPIASATRTTATMIAKIPTERTMKITTTQMRVRMKMATMFTQTMRS